MLTRTFLVVICMLLTANLTLSAHCQMPCGIYHDDLVFDQIDQYVETMYKGDTVLKNSKLSSIEACNECIRWVMMKEKMSDETAALITKYFLQQKIKPDEADTVKKLISAQKLLFLLVEIKQQVNRELIQAFSTEWDKFKLMFHVEGYEYQMEKIKEEKREEAEHKAEAGKP